MITQAKQSSSQAQPLPSNAGREVSREPPTFHLSAQRCTLSLLSLASPPPPLLHCVCTMFFCASMLQRAATELESARLRRFAAGMGLARKEDLLQEVCAHLRLHTCPILPPTHVHLPSLHCNTCPILCRHQHAHAPPNNPSSVLRASPHTPCKLHAVHQD